MPDYRYSCSDCGKTYIGPAQAGMTCNCTPAKVMIGVPYRTPVAPFSDALQEPLRIQEATRRRAQFCEAWGITNKSHSTHGSNFSGTQTLVNLINDIVTPLQGVERQRVRDLIIQQFQYDIDSKTMT